MDKKVTFLTPIEVTRPPHHTQVWPKCFTCAHFPVCTDLRSDYLKTLQLIQNVLGDPQEDLLLQKSDPNRFYPCYEGNDIEDANTIFPATLTFTKRTLPNGEIITDEVIGNFESAKYQDFNTVLFMYDSEGYKIMFKALYNNDNQEFDIYDGIEIVYKIRYEFPSDSVLELQVNLGAWREEMIEKEEENKDIDIINTTYFSAQLNCDFYEAVRGLTPQEGLKRIFAQYPDGIPCGEGQYYHLETLHIEPYKVPWFNPTAGRTAFVPAAYPVFIPTKCEKKKPCRRDDLNDD